MYQTIGNAELKLGLDVDHFMGLGGDNECESMETQPSIKITPGHWNTITVLTQSPKLQVIEKIFPKVK